MNAYACAGNLGQPRANTRWIALPLIAALHVCLIFALQQGMLTTAVPSLPKELVTIFINPAAPPALAPPQLPLISRSLALPAPAIAVIAPPELPSITLPAATSIVAGPVAAALPTVSSAAVATVTATASNSSKTSAEPKSISQLEYLRAPQATYPAQSRRLREQGKVILRVVVNEAGQADSVEVHQSSGSARLDEAARYALLRALFKPYLEDGKAISVAAKAVINFSLDS
ncbi:MULTISPECIES: TonB family protein [unclassified Undibacterium]|uniref:energy transducer TonB n=1 Tax=unclassified Undibacterium TaxID=2630295 RepID=UPI002AC9E558|nr:MULTISPECIES: TonB family protein [unclassified Undibacterium]MEB0139230.1 TonB family protein [Undibacterium sp. CCC2.1]MEB0172074.1 TonB family protein [Undibacterium sp. CCC1.1]MEB0175949.1 TonB family protein [Undibacterium sp. CCC3.4]MEB0215261.1 TonB family protein [Undibacterium sp. 5I2]WPX45436.1 TonB family protein [Undibacterium sp. CCC3.4]